MDGFQFELFIEDFSAQTVNFSKSFEMERWSIGKETTAVSLPLEACVLTTWKCIEKQFRRYREKLDEETASIGIEY